MNELNESLDRLQILQMATGFWWSQALVVASRLRVAEALESGPRSTDDVADELGVDRSSLNRLLRALATMGLFASRGERDFMLTERGTLMLEGHPRSLRPLILSLGELPYRAWGSLEESLRSGRPAFEQVFGASYFDYLDVHPEHSAIFDAAMSSQAQLTSDTVAGSFDFSRFRTLVDVGGGEGILLRAILERTPGLRGVVFDRQAVVARQVGRESKAKSESESESESESARIEWVAGDFFTEDPPLADGYLLALVLHDWDDEACLRILGRIANVLPPEGRLLIVESVIPDGDEPFFAKLLDLHMLVCFGGAERTEPEYRGLLRRAGLSLHRVHPAFGPTSRLSILEAGGLD